jgi:hypothetical protein
MAISKIGSKALVDCSVAAVDIADNSITAAKLAGSIANAKLANSSVTINSTSVSLGGSANINALDWQSVIVADGSTGTTGVAGRGYFINTTSAAHTFTLPVSATRGDTIAIKDYAGTFATFNLTIARNGHKIQGVENNSLISTNRASVVLVYVDVTRGWEYVTESNVAELVPVFISATGGTILTDGNFKTHVFTGDGCFAVSQLGNPIGGGSNVDYLVVAGGGGAFRNFSAGGGAGGFRVSNSYGLPAPTMSPLSTPTGITVTVTSYPITVGAGGTGGPAGAAGGATSGNNSIFSTITSTGGGKGGSSGNGPGDLAGTPGGSGGGGDYNALTASGGTGNTPPVAPSQGNNGGNGGNPSPSSFGSGGGGGAGAAGTSFPSAGNGGIGSFIDDTFLGPTAPSYGESGPVGSTRYFSGGGGAFDSPNVPATTGGIGGGGEPGNEPGVVNTGGGGGGSPSTGAGGAGGKGIVVIRYKFQ